jgi:hypothetical protein
VSDAFIQRLWEKVTTPGLPSGDLLRHEAKLVFEHDCKCAPRTRSWLPVTHACNAGQRHCLHGFLRCRATSCTDSSCKVCGNDALRRCTDNTMFKEKYIASYTVRAGPGACCLLLHCIKLVATLVVLSRSLQDPISASCNSTLRVTLTGQDALQPDAAVEVCRRLLCYFSSLALQLHEVAACRGQWVSLSRGCTGTMSRYNAQRTLARTRRTADMQGKQRQL